MVYEDCFEIIDIPKFECDYKDLMKMIICDIGNLECMVHRLLLKKIRRIWYWWRYFIQTVEQHRAYETTNNNSVGWGICELTCISSGQFEQTFFYCKKSSSVSQGEKRQYWWDIMYSIIRFCRKLSLCCSRRSSKLPLEQGTVYFAPSCAVLQRPRKQSETQITLLSL